MSQAHLFPVVFQGRHKALHFFLDSNMNQLDLLRWIMDKISLQKYREQYSYHSIYLDMDSIQYVLNLPQMGHVKLHNFFF